MTKRRDRIFLKGQSISPGIAEGKAFLYRDILTRDLFSYSIKSHEVKNEVRRIEEAIQIVIHDLEKLKKNFELYVDADKAAVFEAHQEILRDKKLLNDFKMEVKRELVNAEHVISNVFRKWNAKFKSSPSEIIRSRADDMEDIHRRLLRVLLGFEKNVLENLPPESIIVAQRLLPSDTVHLKKENVRGIIVRHGTKNSHSAILAKTLGIPAVANPDKQIEIIKSGETILVDGNEGFIVVNPGQNDLALHNRKRFENKKAQEKLMKGSASAAFTRAGERILVYANASSPEEVKVAIERGCDGIGLLRTEHIYLGIKTLPDESDLKNYLEEVLLAAKEMEVVIRLLDVGGDKKIPFINVEDELSHFLGLRGIRLLLAHENLLKKQLRAMIFLNKKHNVRILVPMVTLPEEMKRTIEIMRECRKELEKEHKIELSDPKVGAMIETPAAVINVKEIAEISDFLSIGTNDLIQYTMAAGREDRFVSSYYEKGVGLIMKSIKEVASAAKEKDIECSICGEIAGDTQWMKNILDAGIKALSVSPYLIPEVKKAITRA